jgi:hypothetical protein
MIGTAELMELMGTKQVSALRKALHKARIPYIEPRSGHPFTTKESIQKVIDGQGAVGINKQPYVNRNSKRLSESRRVVPQTPE